MQNMRKDDLKYVDMSDVLHVRSDAPGLNADFASTSARHAYRFHTRHREQDVQLDKITETNFFQSAC